MICWGETGETGETTGDMCKKSSFHFGVEKGVKLEKSIVQPKQSRTRHLQQKLRSAEDRTEQSGFVEDRFI